MTTATTLANNDNFPLISTLQGLANSDSSKSHPLDFIYGKWVIQHVLSFFELKVPYKVVFSPHDSQIFAVKNSLKPVRQGTIPCRQSEIRGRKQGSVVCNKTLTDNLTHSLPTRYIQPRLDSVIFGHLSFSHFENEKCEITPI